MSLFLKYPTIPTLSNKIIQRQMGSSAHWYAIEKIHGANYSFITDGHSVTAAGRNSLLIDNPDFFDHTEVFLRYSPAVLDLYAAYEANGLLQAGDTLRVYGELAGRDIQENADYGDLDFYAFDLYVNDQRLPYSEVLALQDFKTAPLVGQGSFKSVIALDIKFPTLVDQSCTCEGLILRTDENGLIFKHKNDLFKERVAGIEHMPAWCEYITDNRVRAVVSKEGPFNRANFARYLELIRADIQGAMAEDGVEETIDSKANALISKCIADTYIKKVGDQ